MRSNFSIASPVSTFTFILKSISITTFSLIFLPLTISHEWDNFIFTIVFTCSHYSWQFIFINIIK
ncbi:ORF046 [Staphylococcus phage 96]|nr:ORF046 [Staphylococcus phage 96]